MKPSETGNEGLLLILKQLRTRRRSKAGRSWYVDETYVKVGGKWCYHYRAIDRDGNLVDSMLSEKRDMASARRLFAQGKDVVVGHNRNATEVTVENCTNLVLLRA